MYTRSRYGQPELDVVRWKNDNFKIRCVKLLIAQGTILVPDERPTARKMLEGLESIHGEDVRSALGLSETHLHQANDLVSLA